MFWSADSLLPLWGGWVSFLVCLGRVKLACSTAGWLRVKEWGRSKGWSSKRLPSTFVGWGLFAMKAEASCPHSKKSPLLSSVFEVFEDGGAVGGGEVIDPVAGGVGLEVDPVSGEVFHGPLTPFAFWKILDPGGGGGWIVIELG